MRKPRPECIAFVYGTDDQKRKLLAVSRHMNLSASQTVTKLVEVRFAEIFGDTDPKHLS